MGSSLRKWNKQNKPKLRKVLKLSYINGQLTHHLFIKQSHDARMIPMYTVVTKREAKAICGIKFLLEPQNNQKKSQVAKTYVNFTKASTPLLANVTP